MCSLQQEVQEPSHGRPKNSRQNGRRGTAPFGVHSGPLVLIGGRLAWALRLLREPSHCCYRAGLRSLVADLSSFYISSAEGALRNAIP